MALDALSHPLRTLRERLGGTSAAGSAASSQASVVQGGRIATARVAVITVIEDEFKAAQRALAATHYLESNYFANSSKPHPDVVVGSIGGMGTTLSTGYTKDFIEDFRPEVVILTGIAGGAIGDDGSPRQGVGLGDVFLAPFVHYGDLRKLDASKGDQKRYNPHDHPSHRLFKTASACVTRTPDWYAAIDVTPPSPKAHVQVITQGTLVSCEKIFADRDHPEQKRLMAEYPEAVAVEMEAYGVGRGCYEARQHVDYNPGFLVVRGISDFVASTTPAGVDEAASAHQNQVQRDNWREYAAASAAAFTACCVRAILSEPDRREHLRRTA